MAAVQIYTHHLAKTAVDDMTNIQTTIKNRLLSMIAAGASVERQMRFIQDAVTANRKQGKLIIAEVKKVNPALVADVALPGTTKCSRKVRHSPVSPEQLISLRGSVEFWYQAVKLPIAELRKHLTREEISTITELKNGAMLSGEVASALRISITKLNALDKSGQLPHRFTRRMEIRGNVVQVRCWLAFDVASFRDK